jgi:hypothetical protein
MTFMSQNDFRAAFLNFTGNQLPPPPDPNFLAMEITLRDRSRVRVLAALSLLFWLLGLAGMMVLVFGLNRFVLFVRIADWQQASGPMDRNIRSRWLQDMLWGTQFIHQSIPYIAGSVVCLMFAALLTIWLILTLRQATLNQLNISLMKISQHLANMDQTQGKERQL